MRNSLLEKRKHILESLGGLPGVNVKNSEWLYLLGEETRYSIMIEGIFVSEGELEKALGENVPEKRSVEEAMNYFRTANFVYQLAYQNYRTGEFFFPLSLVRQVNNGVLGIGGDFRRGNIKIAGSKFEPPPFSILSELMQMYTKWTEEHFEVLNPITLSAKSHALFEIIHPFEDGNGRTGRILLNYILISAGYPPAILKEEREKYYSALEESERVFRRQDFFEMKYEKLSNLMEKMNVEKLQNLIVISLIENIDRIIISLFKRKGKSLLKSSEVAERMGFSKESIRTLIKRGKFIAVKIGKSWFTHPELFLG